MDAFVIPRAAFEIMAWVGKQLICALLFVAVSECIAPRFEMQKRIRRCGYANGCYGKIEKDVSSIAKKGNNAISQKYAPSPSNIIIY